MTARSSSAWSATLFYVGLALLVVGALRLVKRAEGPWGPALLGLGALVVLAAIRVARRAPPRPPAPKGPAPLA